LSYFGDKKNKKIICRLKFIYNIMLCKQGKSLVSYLGGNSVSRPAFVLIKDPYRFGGRDFLYFKGRPLVYREMVQVRLFLGNTLRGCA